MQVKHLSQSLVKAHYAYVFVKVVKYLLNVLIQLREMVNFQLFDVFHLTIHFE